MRIFPTAHWWPFRLQRKESRGDRGQSVEKTANEMGEYSKIPRTSKELRSRELKKLSEGKSSLEELRILVMEILK